MDIKQTGFVGVKRSGEAIPLSPTIVVVILLASDQCSLVNTGIEIQLSYHTADVSDFFKKQSD